MFNAISNKDAILLATVPKNYGMISESCNKDAIVFGPTDPARLTDVGMFLSAITRRWGSGPPPIRSWIHPPENVAT